MPRALARRTRPGEQLPRSAHESEELVAQRDDVLHHGHRARPRRRPASAFATGTSSTRTTRPARRASSTSRIFPVLTPLAVDPAHPFPYISNLSLNLAVVVRVPGELTRSDSHGSRCRQLAAALRGASRRRAVRSPRAGHRGAPDGLFPGMEVGRASPVPRHPRRRHRARTTRREDLVAAIESVLRRRTKFADRRPARGRRAMTPEVLELLMPRARARGATTSYRVDGLLDLGGLWSIAGLRPPGAQGGALDAQHADPPQLRGRRGAADLFG